MDLGSVFRARPVERCQLENSFYNIAFPYGVAWALKHRLTLLVNHARGPVAQGRPSRYGPGDWVRVRDADEIRATLDETDRLRGLLFTANQWEYCGRTFQVERVVRHMLDDQYRMRRISRTVALAGATCDVPGGPVGCGRACSLFFRDDWLEPSSASTAEPRVRRPTARVRTLEEIEATLDRSHRLDGIEFFAEMTAYTSRTYPVLRQAEDTWVGRPRWKKPRVGWYVLEGVRCRGTPLGAEGPCDRNCGLLWHGSWLEMHDEEAPIGGSGSVDEHS